LKRITILLVAAVGVLAVSAGIAVAQATRTTVNITPFTVDNPCTEATDPIRFTGTAERLQHIRPDEAGGNHSTRIFFGEDVVGTDASGQQYRLEEVNVTPSRNNPQGPQVEQTQSTTFRVYSLDGGAAPEFLVHTTIHTTTNANGEVVATFNNTTTQCPGAG
jgi:hypothetical protein